MDEEDFIICGYFSQLIKKYFGQDERIIFLQQKKHLLTLKSSNVPPSIVVIDHKPDTINNIPRLNFQKRLDRAKTMRYFSLPPYVKHVYAGICNTVNDNRFCSIPRGIFYPQHNFELIRCVRNANYKKDNLAYANFSVITNHFRKILKEEIIPKRPFITTGPSSHNLDDNNIRRKIKRNKFPELMESYYTNIAKSKFCFCPEGHDAGSFRLWETLYLNTIPIVSNFPYYQNLKQHVPLLILDDYNIITKDFLEDEYDKLINKKYTEGYMTSTYWINKIRYDINNI